MDAIERALSMPAVSPAQLEGALEAACDVPALVREGDALEAAIRLAVLGGGKRLRPALCIAMYHFAGGGSAAGGTDNDNDNDTAAERARVTSVAVALELLHCASLVLDDLPCMDDDALRRGRPAVHAAHGPDTAMLAAAWLAMRAVESVALLAASSAAARPSSCAQDADILLRFARAGQAMARGQHLDLALTGGLQPPDESTVQAVHRGKTGELICAAAVCGALLARAQPEVVGAAQRCGTALGRAFQIADDLVDATRSCEDAGKPVGQDGPALRPTYVRAVGVQESRARVGQLLAEAQAALDDVAGAGDAAGMRALIQLVAVYGGQSL